MTGKSDRLSWAVYALLAVAVSIWIGGCGGAAPDPNASDPNTSDPNTSDPNSVDPNTAERTLLTAADAKILDDATDLYIQERPTKTSTEARAALVERLSNDPGVSQVLLADDGYSIWVKFASGYVSAINTIEGFGNGPTYSSSAMRQALAGRSGQGHRGAQGDGQGR